MKLSIISTMGGFPWGGSEELWYETALYAKKSAHTVNVIIFRKEKTVEKIQILKSKGIQVFYMEKETSIGNSILVRIFEKTGIKLKRKPTPNPLAFINDLQSDLIVLNQGSCSEITYHNNLAEILLSTTTPLAIINHHNFENGIIEESRAERLRNLFAKANKLFFVSQRNKNVLERQLVLKLPQSKIAKNPFNVTAAKILEWPKQATPTIAIVARLDIAFKGQDILLEVLSDEKWKSRTFEINFYGDGPDREKIQSLISFYGLKNKVHLKGHVSDIEEVWKQNHFLMLPSLSEGLPITIIEAMICGRPCLVTDVGDSALLIKESKSGWVAAVSSVAALDNALETAWNQQAEWKQMGELAHDDALGFIEKNAGEQFFAQLTSE